MFQKCPPKSPNTHVIPPVPAVGEQFRVPQVFETGHRPVFLQLALIKNYLIKARLAGMSHGKVISYPREEWRPVLRGSYLQVSSSAWGERESRAQVTIVMSS